MKICSKTYSSFQTILMYYEYKFVVNIWMGYFISFCVNFIQIHVYNKINFYLHHTFFIFSACNIKLSMALINFCLISSAHHALHILMIYKKYQSYILKFHWIFLMLHTQLCINWIQCKSKRIPYLKNIYIYLQDWQIII